MFLLIPTQLQELKVLEGIQGIKGHRQSVVTFETGSLKRRSTIKHQPEKEVLGALNLRQNQTTAEDSFGCTRHLSETKPAYDHSQTGFLWSWNFMISRKWKHTSNTGAENLNKSRPKKLVKLNKLISRIFFLDCLYFLACCVF